MCIEQNSFGFDENQDGCIDDSDGDGIGDNLDLCETLVLDLTYPVDSIGCRPMDNPPSINQVVVTGIDDSVWSGSIRVSWTIEDLDRDLFETGARIMLHQNSTESSYFPIANCNYIENLSNEYQCIWSIPEDLPIFDITGKMMHVQIHVKSLNQSPEANIAPIYFDDDSLFEVTWKNPLLVEDDKKGVKDEDWSVTQRRALVWGVIGLFGVCIFMARLWSSNNAPINVKSGENLIKNYTGFENYTDKGESE